MESIDNKNKPTLGKPGNIIINYKLGDQQIPNYPHGYMGPMFTGELNLNAFKKLEKDTQIPGVTFNGSIEDAKIAEFNGMKCKSEFYTPKGHKWAIDDLIEEDKIFVFNPDAIVYQDLPEETEVETINDPENGFYGTKITHKFIIGVKKEKKNV